MSPESTAGWRIVLVIAGLGLLSVPVVAVATSGAFSSDPLWTTLRVAALGGLTLVLADILLGTLRPLFNRVYKPRTVNRLHVAMGVSGMALVVGHAVMLLAFGTVGYDPAFFWIGPVTLAILAITVFTALQRRLFRRSWRWVHRFNYLAFAAALVHGLGLGFDLRAGSWPRALFLVYAALAVIGFAYRLMSLMNKGSSR